MSSRGLSAGILARNLARLCEREESIAAVCRATGINRQQFNRYLAGESVPSARNLEIICRYFKLSEAELFRAPGGFPAAAGRSEGRGELRAPVERVGALAALRFHK